MLKENMIKGFMNIAREISEMSSCQKRKVGAVIIDCNRRVLSTGYNGTISGSLNCDECFDREHSRVNIILGHLLPGVKVVRPDKSYPDVNTDDILLKYEGDPWVHVDEATFRMLHKKFAELYEVHAEQNALLNLFKTDADLKNDSSIFINLEPCANCAKLIATSGIRHVYYFEKYDGNCHSSEDYFKRAGITYQQIN